MVQRNEDVQRVKLVAVVGVTVYHGTKESIKNFADGEKISVAYTVSEHFQFWPAEPLRLIPRGGPQGDGSDFEIGDDADRNTDNAYALHDASGNV